MMRKICVVITARPSYSRIKTALKAIKEHPDLELQLVVTASAILEKYGRAIDYIQADGFPITARIHSVVEGANLVTAAKTAGLSLTELPTIFDLIKPDVIITIGDRFETMATAASASIMQIPLVHIQGGEITGNIDDKIRHAVSKLADLHFVSTFEAQSRLIKMGEEPEKIFVTGCPSIDIAAQVILNPGLDFDPYEKYGGVGEKRSTDNPYLVVMQHPVTTEHQCARQQIETTLEAIRDLRLPAFWFWPNPDAGSCDTSKGIRSFRELNTKTPIHYFKNMGSIDFLKLLKNSLCLVGNSSAGIRECSFLGVPVVNIGNRQRGRARGQNVIDVEHCPSLISKAIQKQIQHGHYQSENIYGEGDAGARIANILATVSLTCTKTLTY